MSKESKRKPLHVSTEIATAVTALAKKRGWSAGDAADHCIRVGLTRIKALKSYAQSRK